MNHSKVIETANKLMGGGKKILTNQGLTRKELRYLFHRGLVDKRPMKLGNGQVIHQWRLTDLAEGLRK